MSQAFETQQPQTDEGPTFRTLQGLLEAAEPAGAAANVLAFLLLKASPADQLQQVRDQMLYFPSIYMPFLAAA